VLITTAMDTRGFLSGIALAALALALCAQACGPAEELGPPCQHARDCGASGEAMCIELHCVFFDPGASLASASVDLSFGRDMYQAAASGYVHVLWGDLSDGAPVLCEDILAGALALDDPRLNPMHASPKYLVFNWTSGATFFPDNLVQLLHPGPDLIVAAEGFAQLQGGGTRTAVGCSAGTWLTVNQVADVTVALVRP